MAVRIKYRRDKLTQKSSRSDVLEALSIASWPPNQRQTKVSEISNCFWSSSVSRDFIDARICFYEVQEQLVSVQLTCRIVVFGVSEVASIASMVWLRS